MRTLAFSVVFGALAAVAASYVLQTRPSDLPLVEPSPLIGSMPQPPAASERPEPTSEHVGGAVPRTSRPAPLAPIDGRAARLERLIGERIAAYLQERGLSKVDSERIVADGSKQVAECANQAMITLEALTQIPAASQRDRNAVPADPFDALRAKLMTCQENAAQQAGIPLSALQDVLKGAAVDSQRAAEQ